MDHHGNNDNENANSRGECRAALEEVRAAYRSGVKKGNVDALSRTMAFTEVSVSLLFVKSFAMIKLSLR